MNTPIVITPDIVYRSTEAPSDAPSADIVAIAVHPDDVELACGGVLAAASSEGKRVAVVECTRGEMSSRGTPEIRHAEAIEAAKILGLTERWNLGIPDGGVSSTPDHVARVVAAIRYFQPSLLLFPAGFDRHLDHEDAYNLVRRAVFQSGMTKVVTSVFGVRQTPYRPKRLLCYMQTYHFEPDVFIDVSAHFATKMQSITAHASQVHVSGRTPKPDEPQTFISSPAFMGLIESRARYFGALIGVEFAEAFQSVEPLGLHSVSALLH
jgi:bacillithiol biosynthesis deacetylase BshB1